MNFPTELDSYKEVMTLATYTPLETLFGHDTLPAAYEKINNNFELFVYTGSGAQFGLNTLGDVQLTLPASSGQVLRYDETSGKWKNVSPSSLGLTTFDDLQDTKILTLMGVI